MKITIQSKKENEIVDVTESINDVLLEKSIEEGVCILLLKHTSAALTIADLDPGGTDLDYLDAFGAMVPKLKYRHPHDPSHMGDHIMSALIGISLSLPITNGILDLGIWQRVILVELDGPKEREIVVSIIKSN